MSLNVLIAWLSLGVQLPALFGSRGLLPIVQYLAQLRAKEIGPSALPSIFWLSSSDSSLLAVTILGALLAFLSLLGVWPRSLLPLSGMCYLSFVTTGQSFLSFQWDNLLVECCVMAALLPRDRPAPEMSFLWKLLLFKLFFESGIAKVQSPTGDWLDGSAMMSYYETAPLPTTLAWYAHHLPAAWHRFESRWALCFELGLIFLIFGPRRARLLALFVLGSFLVVNFASANYGFFVPLSGALLLVLLDEGDLRWTDRLPRLGGLENFSPIRLIPELQERVSSLRLANTYHLFGSITTHRIEPQIFVVFTNQPGGDAFSGHELEFKFKAGGERYPPPEVAPHIPRVDFRLWFYGLSYQRRTDRYVLNLLDRICHDPEAVQPLFVEPLPEWPVTVKIVYFEYHFTSAAQRAATGDWWTRAQIDESPAIPCGRLGAPGVEPGLIPPNPHRPSP